jgi:hypothetical protein
MFCHVIRIAALVLLAGVPVRSAEISIVTNANPPKVAPPSDEAERALKRFRVPKGFEVELFAAEPLLANPVAFTIDERGRFFVAETFRLHAGVTDIRQHMDWLDEELASKSAPIRTRCPAIRPDRVSMPWRGCRARALRARGRGRGRRRG